MTTPQRPGGLPDKNQSPAHGSPLGNTGKEQDSPGVKHDPKQDTKTDALRPPPVDRNQR